MISDQKFNYHYSELESFETVEKINEAVFLLQENLFQIRMKQLGSSSIKSNVILSSKRRIAQLKFKKNQLLKKINTL